MSDATQKVSRGFWREDAEYLATVKCPAIWWDVELTNHPFFPGKVAVLQFQGFREEEVLDAACENLGEYTVTPAKRLRPARFRVPLPKKELRERTAALKRALKERQK